MQVGAVCRKLVDASQRIIKVTKMDEEDRVTLKFRTKSWSSGNGYFRGKGHRPHGRSCSEEFEEKAKTLYVYADETEYGTNENRGQYGIYLPTLWHLSGANLSKFVRLIGDSCRNAPWCRLLPIWEDRDHAMNIMEVAQNIREASLNSQILWKKNGKSQRRRTVNRITVEASMNSDIAKRVEPLEEVIDDMVITLKNRHRKT